MKAHGDVSIVVREQAQAIGFDLIGIGPAEPFGGEQELILDALARGRLAGMAWITPDRVRLSCTPDALLPGARSIVALGTAYESGEPRPASPGPRLSGRVARYAWGRDYHEVIPPMLHALAAAIVRAAGPETRCRTFVDAGPLVDRAAAARAGVGFIGKNTCVLTGRHGSYVLLSAILTTAELTPDPVRLRDCGTCRACLDACPTGALVAPRQLDATRCISYLTIEHRGLIPLELRCRIGDWVFGCDVCQEVCPWNRGRARATHPELVATAGPGPALDLPEILRLDEAGFRARFRGTALTRARRRGLLRNAAVVLGNRGDPAAIPVLVAALGDNEPLVRGHAAWALAQLRPLPAEAAAALRAALESERDPVAREELAVALAAPDLSGEPDAPPRSPRSQS